ncbi:MAG: hypothetical protein A3B66_00450 [Alphaproteobacteria bacterium RIFCSPHIGHO2_02_FULL_46_13]|nr:MAG: hypothetical protein A3B66_00450 [Alphaproteobacteria bacterium RIFCSPHIGHO2_02_FULL_46_13]
MEKEIVYLPPDKLVPWDKNPRIHGDKQLSALEASIKEFGFTNPILIDDKRTILAGHGRSEAAKRIGLKEVPVVVLRGLSKKEKRAYVIADNKLAQMGQWDTDLLTYQFDELLVEGYDLQCTGFSTAEIDTIMPDILAQPEDGAELEYEDIPKETVSRKGDLWICGPHRLYCGDSLQKSSYEAVMEGRVADLCVTDPPYNVKTKGHICGKGKNKHEDFRMAYGELSIKEFTDFLSTVFGHISGNTSKNATIFSFMDWRHMREVQEAGEKKFGELAQLCVWVKDNGGMGTFYRSQHELVFVFRKGSSGHINNFELGKFRYRTNVWNYPGANTFKGKGNKLLELHPTVKPFSLIADAIRDCSHKQSIILDPFCGSGTILVAAHLTGRCARAIELDETYVDTSVRRWERYTGQSAVLDETGKTFDEMSIIRLNKKVGAK